MSKSWSRLLGFFVLTLVSGAAFADQTNSITASAVSNHTDISMSYLAQVFGTVGTSLQGTSGQMLGQLFYKLNQGILVVAGFWLLYTMITIAIRSAMEGSFMNQNRNVAIILLKIALGLGLLLPNPATGYSIFQDVVMKVVVYGVKLADSTWSYGLNYISVGGSLWHRPEDSAGGGKASNGQSIIKPSEAKNIFHSEAKIFTDEVCMFNAQAKNAALNKMGNGSGSGTGAYNSGVATRQLHPIINAANKTVDFPSSASDQSGCGQVSWASFNGGSISGKVKSDNSDFGGYTIASRAVKSMVDSLVPAARSYFCSTSAGATLPMCSSIGAVDVSHDNGETFFATLVNYINNIMPLVQSTASGDAYVAKSFISSAKSMGWMSAGRYYWDLSRVQAHYNNVTKVGNYYPDVVLHEGGGSSDAMNAAGECTGSEKSVSCTGYLSGAMSKLKSYAEASGSGDTGGSYRENVRGGGNWILDALLTPIGSAITGLVLLFTQSGPYGMSMDPIMFLHNVGMHCISIAGLIWFGGAITIFGMGAATMFCQSEVNSQSPLEDVLQWVKPCLMAVAVSFLLVGVILGYYVPLYPFMLFTFGVISWIIAVIEAMVAAPLVCFGLTHPEGHDFLGQAQQASMLLLSVFIRPVLMVIGLIAAMILSYVSLRILNFTYSNFLTDIFYFTSPETGIDHQLDPLGGALAAMGNVAATGGAAGLIFSIIALPIFLIIFAALVYVVTNQCFSLIYVLPDNILRWIGGPQSQSMGAQMAQQVSGALSSGVQSAGQGMSKGAQAYSAQQDQKKGTKMDVNPNGSGGNSGAGNGAAGGGAAGGGAVI